MENKLCMDCQKACGGCNWSKNLTPVPGWTARPVKYHDAVGGLTYVITACPEYTPLKHRTPYPCDRCGAFIQNLLYICENCSTLELKEAVWRKRNGLPESPKECQVLSTVQRRYDCHGQSAKRLCNRTCKKP